eukprot:gnl/TRDRNA2_/TRDRNA2_193020_c0_seq1.p1 gnl/TRDRNA2_/TRDRNA2_193020_c0~~gnl/TRDRNA2_/TRDRNA2_193020_c0_seq1.p1  ORF type:complete len:161 (+),score=33.44 gnl/TRDRNA2_/TRDRNA2_193020_c0_seq1:38-520(+)
MACRILVRQLQVLLILLGLEYTIASGNLKKLNDKTFEHQTQAGTGATTGDWLVSFGAKGCKPCEKIHEELLEIDSDLRQAYIIPASVDESDSKGLWKRFGIKKVPTTILFSHGKMYQHKEGSDLLNFATENRGAGEKVPPEPTVSILDTIKGLFGMGGEL